MTPTETGPAPRFRILWRIGSRLEIGRSTDTYDRDLAVFWVGSLNADKDNKAVGLRYWMEAEAAEELGGGRC